MREGEKQRCTKEKDTSQLQGNKSWKNKERRVIRVHH